ncbi:hypothetical protein L3X38_002804 [Prunus dulcis]|uniref:Uncharacterized protein n=1 Tax=Prunus dulcis TaxID=3755 RepID=A0AAD4ZLD1_PRUDU|nr:hypothetical protein L3X38_002804 [Prunus dulcis]
MEICKSDFKNSLLSLLLTALLSVFSPAEWLQGLSLHPRRVPGHETSLDWTTTTSVLHFVASPKSRTAPTAEKAQKPSRFSPRFKPLDLAPPPPIPAIKLIIGCGSDISSISEICKDCDLACEDYDLAVEDCSSDRRGISETC